MKKKKTKCLLAMVLAAAVALSALSSDLVFAAESAGADVDTAQEVTEDSIEESSYFITGEDTNHFEASCPESYETGYLEALFDYNEGYPENQMAILEKSQAEPAGYDLGIVLSMICAKEGKLTGLLGESNYWDLGSPIENEELQDVIAFYELTAESYDFSYTAETVNEDESFFEALFVEAENSGSASEEETENILTEEEFLTALTEEAAVSAEEEAPFALIYTIEDVRHAVIVCGCSENEDGDYELLVYDPSSYTDTEDGEAEISCLIMTVFEDFSGFAFTDAEENVVEDTWENMSFLGNGDLGEASWNLLSDAVPEDFTEDVETAEGSDAEESDENGSADSDVDAAADSDIDAGDVSSVIISLLSDDADEGEAAAADEEESEISGTCGDDLTWTFDESTGTLTISGSGEMTDYSSASSLPWYDYRSSVTSVVIGEGVTSIGNRAFWKCSSLTDVAFPDSLETIGKYAFAYCSSLAEIGFSDGLTEIGTYAFGNCSGLTEISLSGNLETIGKYAFYNCSSLTEISFSGNLETIGTSAFENCSSLSEVGFSDGLTEIGDFAFEKCSSLTSLDIPDTVTTIGRTAFGYCTSLSAVELSVNWSEAVDSTGDYGIFIGCSALTAIEIPEGSTTVPKGAFGSCEYLECVTIPDSVTSIGDYAFAECTGLLYVYYAGSEEDWAEISIGSENEYLTGATIYYNSAGPSAAAADFNQIIYRAQCLIEHGYGADILAIETPSRQLVENGEENGLDDLADAWDNLALIVDEMDDPTALVDKALEKEEVYEAILLELLEASLSASVISSEVDDIYDTVKDAVSLVSDGLELGELSYITQGTDQSGLSEEELNELMEGVSSIVEDAFPHLDALGDVLSIISTIAKSVDHIEDFIEYVAAVILLADTDAYTQMLFDTLYENAAGNASLQMAIDECRELMNDSVAGMIEDIILGEMVSLGTDMASYLIKELLWDSFMTAVKAAHPLVATCYYAYKASSLVTNVLFSTDDTTEQYAKMDAFLDIEDLVDETFEELKNGAYNYAYNDDEDSCGEFLAAFDLIYAARDEDFEEAYEFADILDDAILGNIIDCITGSTNYADYKASLEYLQETFYSIYQDRKVNWVNWLNSDYPYSGLYNQYSYLLEEAEENKRTKEYVSACPVDVYVYDTDGELAAYYADGRLHCEEDADVGITLTGDTKTVTVYNDAQFTIKYVGTDTGTMDLTIIEYDEDEEETRTVNYYDVPLTNETTYEMTETVTTVDTDSDSDTDDDSDSNGEDSTETVSEYTLVNTDTSGTVEPDYDTADEAETVYNVEITNGTGRKGNEVFVTTTASAGETIEISALTPDGYVFVKWEVTSGGVTLEDETAAVTSFVMGSEDVTISAVYEELPDIADAEITLSDTALTYTGEAQVPEVTVTYGEETLTEGTDYELSYDEEAVDAGIYEITVSGTGSYTGSATLSYTIEPKSIAGAEVTLSKTSYTYSGSANKPTVKSITLDGVTLTAGTDYSTTLKYSNNTSAGTGTVKVTGTGNYTGTASATFTIKKESYSSGTVTLSYTSTTYSGSAKKPTVKSVKVILNGSTKTLTKNTDYTVSYKNNKAIGKASVVITLKGNYSGTITKTFTIKPKKVSISSAKSSAKKKITVKWKKSSGSVKYQIAYRKKGSSTWKYKTVSSTTYKKTLTGLTSGKYYYVKVRAYKKVSGKTYYGSWSSTKKVKVK